MNLLIKYATRGRPALFFSTLERLRGLAITQPKIVVSMDRSDMLMNSNKIRAALDQMPDVTYHYGESKTKVQAINADIAADGWGVMLVASDDHIPVVQGYDKIILDHMAEHFPDTDGSLWFDDVRQPAINFVPIIGKAYYDRYGYVYHPEYISLWCDNEQTEVGLRDGKLKKCQGEIFRNESPDWGGSHKVDTLYRKNNSFFKIDEATFWRRKALNFP